MEITSNLPLSRRGMLQSIVFGGTTALFHPRALADHVDLNPVSFIVVTDTHIGYRGKDGAAQRWVLTAKAIADAKGDLVIHLGDVVDARREDQYPVYLKTRKTIGKPVHEIPGNHDPEGLFRKYLRKEMDTVVEHRWLRFVLLNNSRTDSHDGFLSKEQIAWIDKQCVQAAKDDKFVIIAMHVPAHFNRPPDRAWYVKPKHGQTELYKVIARHEHRILALFHGHFHNGIRGWQDHGPVHEICFPSALYNQNRGLEAKQAPGYNPSTFDPGFTQVTIENGVMALNYQPVGKGKPLTHPCPLKQILPSRKGA